MDGQLECNGVWRGTGKNKLGEEMEALPLNENELQERSKKIGDKASPRGGSTSLYSSNVCQEFEAENGDMEKWRLGLLALAERERDGVKSVRARMRPI